MKHASNQIKSCVFLYYLNLSVKERGELIRKLLIDKNSVDKKELDITHDTFDKFSPKLISTIHDIIGLTTVNDFSTYRCFLRYLYYI